MNKVMSRFVPNLRPEQDNKVSGARPTNKKTFGLHGLYKIIQSFEC